MYDAGTVRQSSVPALDPQNSWDHDKNCYQTWHGLWGLVIKADAAPYIEELVASPAANGDATKDQSEKASGPFDELVHRELFEFYLRVSPWIPLESKAAVLSSALHGSEDAVMSVLLPLLINLRVVDLGPEYDGDEWREHSTGVLSRIAKDGKRGALTKLERISLLGEYHWGFDLQSIVPFLSLPTVRFLEISRCRNDDFDWSLDLPKSRVEKIVIYSSTVSSTVIRRFAKGLLGPCIIWQQWGDRRHDLLPEPNNDWNYCEVPFEGAGEDDLIINIEDEIGAEFEVDQGLYCGRHCVTSNIDIFTRMNQSIR